MAAELALDVAAVDFHRAATEAEFFGDIARGEAAAHGGEDFAFADQPAFVVLLVGVDVGVDIHHSVNLYKTYAGLGMGGSQPQSLCWMNAFSAGRDFLCLTGTSNG